MSTPNATHGPHTGKLVCKLPVGDLGKKGAGAWDGRVKWNRSGLATFQNEPVVRAFYQKGSGTSRHPHHDGSGCSFTCQSPAVKGQRGAVVAFDLFFDPASWHWSKGGKVAGLFVGPGKASGYRHSEDGASHRMMWQRDGGAISYVYPPANLKQKDPKLSDEGHGVGYFGDTFPAGTLKVGRWNHVEIGVKVNTFADSGKPRADGMSMLTINGVTGVLDNVRWARNPALAIDNFNYGTFFGGPDPAVVDSVSYAKNFEVYTWA